MSAWPSFPGAAGNTPGGAGVLGRLNGVQTCGKDHMPVRPGYTTIHARRGRLKLTLVFVIIIAVVTATMGGCTSGKNQTDEGPLTCVVSIQRNSAARGAVPLRITLTNRSAVALDLGLQGNPAFRFSVVTNSGALVWESTGSEPVQQILELRRLAPSDSIVFECTWNRTDTAGHAVPAGEYLVQGRVELDPPLTARATPVPLILD
jgi:hypothetical protein